MKTTNIPVGVAYDNATERQKEFHEHEFVRATGKGTDGFFVQCLIAEHTTVTFVARL
jgi:hypothetical protein